MGQVQCHCSLPLPLPLPLFLPFALAFAILVSSLCLMTSGWPSGRTFLLQILILPFFLIVVHLIVSDAGMEDELAELPCCCGHCAQALCCRSAAEALAAVAGCGAACTSAACEVAAALAD